MTQRSRFFDSSAGDRVYNSEAWAQVLAGILTEGYVPNLDDELEVVESTPAAMSVDVGLGVAFLGNGHDRRYFQVYSVEETLTIATADATNPRIDRVVVRVDYTTRTATLAVLTGTPAASPSAPALTRTSSTYEISLARVAVAAGAASIVNANITDERNDETLCGQAVPHGGSWTEWTNSSTAADGTVTVFNIGSGVAANKVQVKRNGIVLTEGASEDYTHTAGASTVTFNTAPANGAKIAMSWVAA